MKQCLEETNKSIQVGNSLKKDTPEPAAGSAAMMGEYVMERWDTILCRKVRLGNGEEQVNRMTLYNQPPETTMMSLL